MIALARFRTILWTSLVHHALSFHINPTCGGTCSTFLARQSFLSTSEKSGVGRGHHDNGRRSNTGNSHGTTMIFDFIKKRAQEGVEQTQNLVTAAQEGRLKDALEETSAYVKER